MENKKMERMIKHLYAVGVDSLEFLREAIEMLQEIQDMLLEYRRDGGEKNRNES